MCVYYIIQLYTDYVMTSTKTLSEWDTAQFTTIQHSGKDETENDGSDGMVASCVCGGGVSVVQAVLKLAPAALEAALPPDSSCDAIEV